MPGFVTVACKLPNGILMEMPGRQTAEIKGSALRFGEIPAFVIAGGYALTPNVDADLVEAWLAANKGADLVKNHLIFAHAKQSDAAAQAKEMAEQKSGLEPIDPNKPAAGIDRFVGA